jgi:pimeloyl-ACP methyl ester carboxylesterase
MQQTLNGRRLLTMIAAVLFLWVPTAAVAQTASASPPSPPPGRLVDLGGWRLHLNCTGEARASQPTVILEAGAGGFSVDWSLVQPEVARFARVCSYDRAGRGWSDLGPRPRTLRQVVWELHTLIEKAGVRPPYVFVGQSYGGILSRLYALTYPSEVSGMVFVESGHERGVAVLRNGQMVRLVETATGGPIPAVKTSDPLRESDIPGNIRSQIEAAARQMTPHATTPPYNQLPSDAQRMRVWSFSQIKHWATNDNPFEGEELAALLARQEKNKHPFGNLPLIVLSRGLREHGGPEGDAVEKEHNQNQAALVSLSSVGKQVIARRSGHEILITEPELVAAAIRDLMASITSRK